MRTLFDLGVGESKLYFTFFLQEKKERIFFCKKAKNIFIFRVILDSCTILIDFDLLWLNIGTVYMLNPSCKCVISYPDSKLDISL